jgi:drug/metabolite transporter (DMT)-like permease
MPWLRGAALLAGAAGLALVLGADDGVPLPRGLADGFGLAAGVLWSISSTGVRTQAPIPPARAAFVFALGALAGTALMAPWLAPWLAPWPGVPAATALLPALGWILLAGALCWGVCMAGLMWATARLEPARVGILLMGEVLVGTASAALIAGEALGPVEAAGGVLVIAAAVLEVWPVRPSRPDPRAL